MRLARPVSAWRGVGVTAAALATLLLTASSVAAQSYHWTTLAGLPTAGGGDGTGATAQFNFPWGVDYDAAGNLYVADDQNNTIRKVTPAGVVTTIAGLAGSRGCVNGTGAAARFDRPAQVAVASDGTIYVAGNFDHTIRKVTPAGVVTTFAGVCYAPGHTDATGAAARMVAPTGLAIDASDNLYTMEAFNTLRKVTPAGDVTTLAGVHQAAGGYADGTGGAAQFNLSYGLDVLPDGSLIFVADSSNHVIRQVTAAGVVTTIAGTGLTLGSADGTGAAARFNLPRDVAVDAAGTTLWITDAGNHTIRAMNLGTGAVTTLAGVVGAAGYLDGVGARFNLPYGIALDPTTGNTLAVADVNNNALRKVTTAGVVSALAGVIFGGVDGTGTVAKFSQPYGVGVGPTNLVYVMTQGGQTLRQVTGGGVVTTLAGLNNSVGSADGTGNVARFNFPRGVAVGTDGTIYVADRINHTIRKSTPGGVVTTLAGSAGVPGSTDATGAAARFNFPSGVAVDASNNVYVADTGNHTIRVVTPAGVVSTLAGTVLTSGSADGTGAVARFNFPLGIAVNANAIFVADTSNNTIRKVTFGGVVTTVAGQAGVAAGSANGTGNAARFNQPSGVAVDAADTVFVADAGNNTIRAVSAGAVVTTVGGRAGERGSLSGVGNQALFFAPTGIALGARGAIFVTDQSSHAVRMGTPVGTTVLLNGDFSTGTTANWTPFSPSPGGIVSNVTGGVFQFYRPAGSTEAEIIHATGMPLPANAPLEATFSLGNTDTVRKRFKVLIHDLDFSDSLSCTFFLDASAPLRTFTMRMHSTRAWTNTAITFYGSTTGSGGFYQVDNVSLQFNAAGAVDEAECVDPLAPAAPGGADGPTLLANGDFASGALLPGWGTDGPIVQQITGGVLQMVRGAGSPAPVVLQPTGQAMLDNQILTATLQLGNSSAVRKRVKVLIHDVDFTDSPSCIFWIPPGQTLQTYTMRVYATKAWGNATISVYPSTSGAEQWTLLDNVTLQRTPGTATSGTNCFEPGALPRSAPPRAAAPQLTVPRGAPAPEAPADSAATDSTSDWLPSSTGEFVTSPDATWAEDGSGWEAVATTTEPAILRRAESVDLRDATSATLSFQSWLSTTSSRAEVQVSTNGVDWITVSIVPTSTTWVPIEVDLRDFLGEVVQVQFVFYGVAPADLKVGGSIDDPDVWRVDEIQVDY